MIVCHECFIVVAFTLHVHIHVYAMIIDFIQEFEGSVWLHKRSSNCCSCQYSKPKSGGEQNCHNNFTP